MTPGQEHDVSVILTRVGEAWSPYMFFRGRTSNLVGLYLVHANGATVLALLQGIMHSLLDLD